MEGEPARGAAAPRPISRRAVLRAGLGAGAALAAGLGARRGLAAGAADARPAPPGVPSAQVPTAADPDAVVRDRVQAYLARAGTPGVAVALYLDGQDRYYSFGYADGETALPVTEDVLFNLGSVTKVFTATLLASQVVDPAAPAPKRLSDPVTGYLPPAVGGGALATVTLQDLATHTAGMPSQAAGVTRPGERLFDDQPPDSNLLHWWQTWAPPAQHPPGTHYEYSNVGFVTLGYAVVGQPGPPGAPGYTGLLARTITEPLGMRVTANQPLPGHLLARGYLKNGDTLRLVQTRAANIHSSARDMLTWVKANLGLLDAAIPPTLAAALALTHNVYFTPGGDQRLPFDMGLAWEIRNRRPDSPAILTKNGATSTSAHSCAVAFVPARQMGLAVLANSFGPGTDPTGLAVDVLRTLAG